MNKTYAIERTQQYLNANENALSQDVKEAMQIVINLAHYALRLATDIKEIVKEEK